MRPVDVLPPESSISDAAKIMKESRVEMLPVGTREDIRGVVTPREIAIATAEPCNAQAMPVADVTSNVLPFCDEDQEVGEALKTMRSTHQTRLLVRDHEGHTVGVVEISDILAAQPANELANDS